MNIKRGEIWRLENKSTSICKDDYICVVVSNDALDQLPIRLVVPISIWKEEYSIAPWLIRLDISSQNGLEKVSVADALQIHSVLQACFLEKRGCLSKDEMNKILDGIGICLELRE